MGAPPLSDMTWCWLTRAFGTFLEEEVCFPSQNGSSPVPRLSLWSRKNPVVKVILRRLEVTTTGARTLSHHAVPSNSHFVGYPNQYSIYFYARFHQENLKQDPLNSCPPKFYGYFYTLLISNFKFEITTVPQISL